MLLHATPDKFGVHVAATSSYLPIAIVTSVGIVQLSDNEGCPIVDWLLYSIVFDGKNFDTYFCSPVW